MSSVNLTPRDEAILHAVAKVGTVTVDDWEQVAKLADMKTAKYARDSWATLRKKLTADVTTKSAKPADGGDDGNADGVTAVTPTSKAKKKVTPRKRKTDADDEESPLIKKKTPACAKKKAKVEDEDADADDEQPDVKDEPNDAGDMMDDLLGF